MSQFPPEWEALEVRCTFKAFPFQGKVGGEAARMRWWYALRPASHCERKPPHFFLPAQKETGWP